MKVKILVLVFLSLILNSCWSDDTTTTSWSVSWLVTNENTFFSIWVPEKWNILDKNDKSIPTPKSWEVSLVAISSELNYWFSNNMLVLTQDLAKETTSNDFSILNNVWATKEYDEYTKLDSKQISFNDWDTTTLYVFEAKYNVNTPTLKFIQAWKVCNYKKAHLITIALSSDIENTSSYEDIVKSIKCK